MLKLSTFLDEVSKENHPLYYPAQVLQFSALSYIGTAVLNATWIISTPPFHGMAFIVIAGAARKAVTPIFTNLLNSHPSDASVYKAHQFLIWTTAILISKVTCALFGISLGISQMILVSIAFLAAISVAQLFAQSICNRFHPRPLQESTWS